LIVRFARSFTANQSNAMALKKVLNSQLMSGLLNAWDVAHLASSWSMMTGLENCQMAIYEFKCDQCGTMAIINRAIDSDGDVDAGNCMACAIPMTRIWSDIAAVFKGTGWGKDV
jgi:predicted nucleic acid-binding Zn ribbon protein